MREELPRLNIVALSLISTCRTSQYAHRAAWTRSGKFFVTASHDATIRVFRLSEPSASEDTATLSFTEVWHVPFASTVEDVEPLKASGFYGAPEGCPLNLSHRKIGLGDLSSREDEERRGAIASWLGIRLAFNQGCRIMSLDIADVSQGDIIAVASRNDHCLRLLDLATKQVPPPLVSYRFIWLCEVGPGMIREGKGHSLSWRG